MIFAERGFVLVQIVENEWYKTVQNFLSLSLSLCLSLVFCLLSTGKIFCLEYWGYAYACSYPQGDDASEGN
jgi:hypothetical protein